MHFYPLFNYILVLYMFYVHIQEAAVRRTREIKENCEKIVSTLYGGRKINIIGEINSVLGQA